MVTATFVTLLKISPGHPSLVAVESLFKHSLLDLREDNIGATLLILVRFVDFCPLVHVLLEIAFFHDPSASCKRLAPRLVDLRLLNFDFFL